MTQDHGKHGKHTDSNHDTDAPASDVRDPGDRRATLRTLLAGSAVAGFTLPDNWKRPIVQAVVLPAHAQTTGGPDPDDPSDDDPPLLAECDASLISVVTGSGGGEPGSELFAEGEAFISAGCIDEDPSSRTWECELIHDGSILVPDGETTFDDCDGSLPLTDGCIVSCSVFVSWVNQTASPGDSITMRFTFGGDCVCSGVTTVAGGG